MPRWSNAREHYWAAHERQMRPKPDGFGTTPGRPLPTLSVPTPPSGYATLIAATP